ncbi:hypothetical protein Tco_1200425 [Tanacetum coccineum]
MPICEGSCRLTFLERQEVWNDCRSCKVRVGSNGYLLWEASVLYDEKKGGSFRMCMEELRREYESHVKMIVESLKEEKMYVKFSNNVEAEHRGSYLDVEGIKWVLKKDCMTNVKSIVAVGITGSAFIPLSSFSPSLVLPSYNARALSEQSHGRVIYTDHECPPSHTLQSED